MDMCGIRECPHWGWQGLLQGTAHALNNPYAFTISGGRSYGWIGDYGDHRITFGLF